MVKVGLPQGTIHVFSYLFKGYLKTVTAADARKKKNNERKEQWRLERAVSKVGIALTTFETFGKCKFKTLN